MPYSDSLAQRIRKQFGRRRDITDKKMFGGLCFFLNGNICLGVWHNSLIARVGPEAAIDALKQPDVVPFDITGSPMKAWIMVEPDGLERDDQLRRWMEKAEAFVGSLPKKPASRKQPTRRSPAKPAPAIRRGTKKRSKPNK